MKLKVKKLNERAIIPKYATQGSACFDLHSLNNGMTLPSLPHTFSTGLSFEVPDNHVMLVFSRSGHGFKNDTRLANCVGVVDSDYRGEVKVKLTKDATGLFEVNEGDRIAQAMIIPVQQFELVEVEELSETVRGEGGFGSTGK